MPNIVITVGWILVYGLYEPLAFITAVIWNKVQNKLKTFGITSES
uniref:Uncharacterized protein n=1 Tax=Anopheles christyi TaxID=43041 RepID=A0A182KI98_9DIPT